MLGYPIKSSFIITKILYDAMIREQEERMQEARDPSIIYVTDLVACTHKYHLRHVFPEVTVRFEPSAVMGNLVHLGLEKYLEENGFQIEVQLEKKYKIEGKEYLLKGRIDAYKPDEKIIVEIKSSRTPQNLPREHHIYQLQIYMNLLDTDKGILIYITPDKILEYTFRKEKIDIKSLIKLLIEDSVHPKWAWECRYCLFQKICPYKASEQEIK